MKLHSVGLLRIIKNYAHDVLGMKATTSFMCLLFIATLSLSSIPIGHASAAAQTGLYSGLAKVPEQNSFSAWLGNPVPYATDYVDYRTGWDNDFNPYWLIGPWSTWVKAEPGRRLILGLPLLENSNAGQFELGAAGAFDSYFKNLGQNMVNNGLGNSIIRLGYEANYPGIGPWQATDNPSGYVKHFRHIVGVLRSVPNSNFLIDWTSSAGLQTGHVLNSFDSYYPGDDVVDIVGMDLYDMKWMDTTSTPIQRWQFNLTQTMGLNDHRTFAALHNKPVSFPEWGLYKTGDQFGGGGDDPYYIDQMADWFASSNTYYQSYFNINWGGGILSDFPNGQARYKARFGQAIIPTASDTTAPIVSINAPMTNTTVGSSTTIKAVATDNKSVTKMEVYVDGARKYTINSASLSYNASIKQRGLHSITVKAYDGAANTGQSSVTVWR